MSTIRVRATYDETLFPPVSGSKDPRFRQFSLEYARQGKLTRRKQRDPDGRRCDVVTADGVHKTLYSEFPQDGRRLAHAAIQPLDSDPIPNDTWRLGLLELPNLGLPLYQLAEKPHQLRSIKLEKSGNAELYYLEILLDKAVRLEVWVDPQTNFLIRRAVRHSGNWRIEGRVLRFSEVEPSYFFPQEVEWHYDENGSRVVERRLQCQQIEINRELPAETFVMNYPDGISLSDAVQGTLYPIDRKGNPTGPAVKPIVPVVSPGGDATAPTRPWSKRGLLLAFVVPATLLGLGVSIWRKLRQRS
jgi:hypothetical protein